MVDLGRSTAGAIRPPDHDQIGLLPAAMANGGVGHTVARVGGDIPADAWVAHVVRRDGTTGVLDGRGAAVALESKLAELVEVLVKVNRRAERRLGIIPGENAATAEGGVSSVQAPDVLERDIRRACVAHGHVGLLLGAKVERQDEVGVGTEVRSSLATTAALVRAVQQTEATAPAWGPYLGAAKVDPLDRVSTHVESVRCGRTKVKRSHQTIT